MCIRKFIGSFIIITFLHDLVEDKIWWFQKDPAICEYQSQF